MIEESTTDPPEEPEAPAAADPQQPAAEGSAAGNGPQASGTPPPYAPAEAVSGLVEPESGPPPELLVGAP